MNNGTLTIERSIVEVPGGLLEKDTKTHANRRIALDDNTVAVFKEQHHRAEQRATLIDETVGSDAFIFSREPNGATPWTPDRVTKRFAGIRDELGYDKMRFHDLRHFAATRLMAAGVPVRTVSGRLGHANPSTTLSVYSHFVAASDQEAANVMGRLVSSSKLGNSVQSTAPKPVRKTAASTRRRS